jgi:hypothetical protein
MTAPDTTHSAIVTSHPYMPRDQWWSLCDVCGLAEAAHTETQATSDLRLRMGRSSGHEETNQ